MRKTPTALAAVALLSLAACGSKKPTPAASEQSLDDAVNVATDVATDPMAPATGAPVPEASSGGAAVH